jgi:hypothetical protein
MDNTLLELHKVWMETGRMDDCGLCWAIPHGYRSVFSKAMAPTSEDEQVLLGDDNSLLYWGSGVHCFHHDKTYTYTPLRQTILLLFHEYINS